jgi:RNA polymerase sigma factor (TIGR02999 family)
LVNDPDNHVHEEDITGLLHAWRGGSSSAEQDLMRAVYPVLRELARARSARLPSDFTLRPTDLVNEAYLRLAGYPVEWKDRAHFFAVSARVIRNIVVDYVRARGAEKRGGDLPFIALDLAHDVVGEDGIDLRVDWLGVHTALDELEALHARVARVVELKFFSGLTNEEIAEATGSSRSNVVRDWRFARSWLAVRLGPAAGAA